MRAIRVWIDDQIYRDFEAHLHKIKTNPYNGDLMIVDSEEEIIVVYKDYVMVERVNTYKGPKIRSIFDDFAEELRSSEEGAKDA